MTRSAPLISQSALRAWMALGLASIACATVPGPARGSETAPAAHAAQAAPADSAPAVEAPKPAASRAAAKAGPKPILDPMEMLREKLAQKLSAARAAEAGGANVLRVSSKAEAPAVEPAHPPAAARPAVRAPKSDLLASLKAEKSGAGRDAHWSYLGSGGPESWATLKPEFAKCSAGQRQSPIDIRGGVKVDLDPVQFDYRPSTFSVIDNGHTVQVNVGAGNTIEVQGRRFDLVQFHFHRPSEERIDGRQFDMVAHLVHKDIEGRLAVVAVLLDRGSAHPLVQSVWNNLPLEKNEALPARGALDLNNLLPPDRRYYTYMGSLTTPPCSEGVLWLVMQQPVPVSGEQIAVFSRLYPMNARPIQSASGRLIKQSY